MTIVIHKLPQQIGIRMKSKWLEREAVEINFKLRVLVGAVKQNGNVDVEINKFLPCERQ